MTLRYFLGRVCNAGSCDRPLGHAGLNGHSAHTQADGPSSEDSLGPKAFNLGCVVCGSFDRITLVFNKSAYGLCYRCYRNKDGCIDVETHMNAVCNLRPYSDFEKKYRRLETKLNYIFACCGPDRMPIILYDNGNKAGLGPLFAEIKEILEEGMKTLPATHCEHANEVPGTCPCPSNCYCKKNTCRWGQPGAPKPPRMKGHGPECRYSKYAGRKGPCTCGFDAQRDAERMVENAPPSDAALAEARPWCAAHAILTLNFPHQCMHCFALARAFDKFALDNSRHSD